jgi:ubiquinone/menaquinone biosynthesis C-methylase UbiE
MDYSARLENERRHFNQIARQQADAPLLMETANLDRYRTTSSHTPFPLEYAFHLAGDLRGKTVVELGCGDGLNTVKIAAFGAKAIAIDISEESLALSRRRAQANGVDGAITFVQADAAKLDGLNDSSADIVFAVSVLHHVDVAAAAAEIRRVLKPGGHAIFIEPPAGPAIWRFCKRVLPRAAEVTQDEQPLTPAQIAHITRTVGRPGPFRYFGLTYRLFKRLNLRNRSVVHASHILDAWLLTRMTWLCKIASPLVWRADKPL